MKKIPVGILGATGMVGQHYVQKLASHPLFEIAFLAASPSSAGKSYSKAIEGREFYPIAPSIAAMPLHAVNEIAVAKERCRLVFSAVDSATAKEFEMKYAAAGLGVMTNVSTHRLDADVPLLIPEVNPEHLDAVHQQRKNRNYSGFVIAKPNCSLQSYLIPLYPLHKQFGIKRLVITTMQALSGAGYPGISSIDMVDNVIPFISGEEQKSEREPMKILGTLREGHIQPIELLIGVHCNRVPVIDGHMACISVEFKHKPTHEEILALWRDFKGEPQRLRLPSAPAQPIVYREEKDRPQPRLDRLAGEGMAVTVGRLRECPVFHYRFVALSHNTLRGAAAGGILNAELAIARGLL